MKVTNGHRSHITICIYRYFAGDFEDLKVIMRSTELKVNITVEEVLAGEATGEHFTLQMAGVISPLLTGKPNELQVYIVSLKS